MSDDVDSLCQLLFFNSKVIRLVVYEKVEEDDDADYAHTSNDFA